MLGITPVISVLGIMGNMFSILILTKHGLQKCSNILLLSLAGNDVLYLIGFNSIPKLLYEVAACEEGFHYNHDVSHLLFYLHHIFHNIDYACSSTSLTLPMLITFERLFAVFLPMKFHRFVTPCRTWFAVALVNISWAAYFIHMSFLATFTYDYNPRLNMSVGLITRSAYFYDHSQMVVILEGVMTYLIVQIPPFVTMAGCVVIAIKVKVASVQRKRLTLQNKKCAALSRTTRTLLAVCMVYTFTCAVLNLPNYIPEYMYNSMVSDAPSNLGRVLYQVMSLALCLNSSCNFVVYVVMNKNFRTTHIAMFACKHQPRCTSA
ncbi:unnamed protein product [Lymnaea stagnalis]|uniref:G-protein coupled receptors family 1 profile domain-containing protein n=1 Tax=Lymnaea stagnalis TaxID=6523 RepID=A0AAV2HX42_LYMST